MKQATPAQQVLMQATWSRYRRFIIGLSGIHGEIIAAHLAVEAELEDRLKLLIAHPEVLLERASFSQKIKLLVGLWPGPFPLDSPALRNIRALGKVRNMIAHGDPDEKIAAEINRLLPAHSRDTDDERIEALRSMTMGVCGFLGGVTHGIEKAAITLPDEANT